MVRRGGHWSAMSLPGEPVTELREGATRDIHAAEADRSPDAVKIERSSLFWFQPSRDSSVESKDSLDNPSVIDRRLAHLSSKVKSHIEYLVVG